MGQSEFKGKEKMREISGLENKKIKYLNKQSL